MNYLFVDIAVINRSPWSADWLSGQLRRREIGGTVGCAGIGLVQERYKLTEGMIRQADIIFAMDDHIAREIIDRYPVADGKVVDIDVPDKFNHWIRDGVLPEDITYEELKEYMRTQEFGTKAMAMYLERVVLPFFI